MLAISAYWINYEFLTSGLGKLTFDVLIMIYQIQSIKVALGNRFSGHTKLKQRRFKVYYQRWSDVVLKLCARWGTHKRMKIWVSWYANNVVCRAASAAPSSPPLFLPLTGFLLNDMLFRKQIRIKYLDVRIKFTYLGNICEMSVQVPSILFLRMFILQRIIYTYTAIARFFIKTKSQLLNNHTISFSLKASV